MLALISNRQGPAVEQVARTSRPESMSRNSGILALDIYPDRVMMDPSQMVPGKLYQFELSGEPLIAIKKGSGGIQIYYFPS